MKITIEAELYPIGHFEEGALKVLSASFENGRPVDLSKSTLGRVYIPTLENKKYRVGLTGAYGLAQVFTQMKSALRKMRLFSGVTSSTDWKPQISKGVVLIVETVDVEGRNDNAG